MRGARGLWIAATVASVAGLPACGDDAGSAGSGGGCTTDVECKGDRICEQGQCVDPDEAARDAGTAGAKAGAAGRSSTAATDGGAAGGGGGTDSGSGGSSAARGGSGGTAVIDDPELEAACSLDCEARQAASCEMNIGSLDQCLAQCLVVDESSMGYCLPEMTARYACLASGGYSCISGYPQPKSTCIEEQTKLAECQRLTPCRAYCAAAEGDCAPAGDDCMSACMEMESSFDDALCGIYYQQLLSCWARTGPCVDGQAAISDCGRAIGEVGDCIGRRGHVCEGYCWTAETLGCGSADCVETCMTAADDAACGFYYERMLDCGLRGSLELQLACVDGAPVVDPTECESDIMQYESCMGM